VADDETTVPTPSDETGRTEAMTTPDTVTTGTDTTEIATRRGPDPLTLVVGLATLAMALFAFTGTLPDLSFVDPRWVLAGGAAVVGLVLLVGSLRGRSGRRG
jgi:hypothetical protein